ncbi:MAG: hypothetical protein Q8O03_01790 [Nanoarchaeota archaeon]|nr:hypothetical protein [Nanoarchaeota archaeon]
MASLKDKAINTGLSILIGSALIVLGADMARMIRQDRRSSLRERVYELVLQKYKGDYYTKIDGKDVHVGAITFESNMPYLKNRGLYVEVKNEKDGLYLLDLTNAESADDTFFGDLDCSWGKIKDPEQEFDNYLRLVKKEIRKS